MAGRALGIVFQFLVIKYYAKWLKPDQLGEFYFLSTISYVFNALVLVPLDLCQQPKALQLWGTKGSAWPSLRLQFTLLAAGVACAIAIECLVFNLFPKQLGIATTLVGLAFGLYSINSWRVFFNNIGWQKLAVLFYLLDPVARYLVLRFSIHFSEVTPGSVLASNAIAYGLLVPLCVGFMFFRGGLVVVVAPAMRIGRLWRQAIALSFSAMTNLIQMQGYRLVLVPLGFSSEVGRFALVSQFGATAANSVGAIYGLVNQPKVYRDPVRETRPYISGGLVVILFLCLAALIAGPILLPLVTTAEYRSLFPLLTVGILLEGGNLIVGGLSVGLTSRGAKRELFVASACGVVVFAIVLVFLLLAKEVTIVTLGVPLVLGQVVACGVLYRFERKYWR